MRKKVLILMDRMDSGGVPRVLLNLLDHIDTDKFDITVAITCKGDLWEKQIPKWVKVIHLFENTAPNRSKNPIVRFLYLLFHIFVPGCIIRKLFLKQRYDVYIDFFGSMLGFWKGSKDRKIIWLHKDFSLENNPLERQYKENYGKTFKYRFNKI